MLWGCDIPLQHRLKVGDSASEQTDQVVPLFGKAVCSGGLHSSDSIGNSMPGN